MSLFKDQVAADIAATFINVDEFADEHNIDGVVLKAVIDRGIDERDTLFNYERPSHPAYGVYAENITMYISLTELGYKPEVDQPMEVDGETCIVKSCHDDMGLLTIVLEGNRS